MQSHAHSRRSGRHSRLVRSTRRYATRLREAHRERMVVWVERFEARPASLPG